MSSLFLKVSNELDTSYLSLHCPRDARHILLNHRLKLFETYISRTDTVALPRDRKELWNDALISARHAIDNGVADPELHLLLLRLTAGEAREPRELTRLASYLGGAPLSDIWRGEGCIRAVASKNTIISCRKKQFVSHSSKIEVLGSQISIINGTRDFYHDLWKEEIGITSAPDVLKNASNLIESVLNLMRDLDSFLYDLLTKHISQIVIFGDTTINNRDSFSFRTSYPGVIFIRYDPSPTRLFEAILHEFVHQYLWLAWTFFPPKWMEIRNAQILSPISNNVRCGDVMFHALLIYGLTATYFRVGRKAGVFERPPTTSYISKLERAASNIATQLINSKESTKELNCTLHEIQCVFKLERSEAYV